MKRLITAIALAAFFAAPAIAKTAAASRHHQSESTQGQYLQAAPSGVTEGGRFTGGQDPDANVRSELQRDYGQSEGAY